MCVFGVSSGGGGGLGSLACMYGKHVRVPQKQGRKPVSFRGGDYNTFFATVWLKWEKNEYGM